MVEDGSYTITYYFSVKLGRYIVPANGGYFANYQDYWWEAS